jgi:hypothetical protein
VLADVNSDGRPDLITENPLGSTAAILINAGYGNFTGQTYTVQSPVATVVSNGPNPSTITQALSFSVSVSGGVPDGEVVTLQDASNNNAVLATGALLAGSASFNFAAGTLPFGTHNLFAVYSGDTNYAASQSSVLAQTVEVLETSVVVNGNNASLAGLQRSMVNSLVYTFSEAVTLGANAFVIVVHNGQTGTIPTLNYTSSDGGITWIVTFSGNGVVGNSIANGVYDITLSTDPTVVSSVNHPGAPVQAQTNTFYRLFGDINGDHVVNAADNLQFRTALSVYNAIFDYNGDGAVNAADNLKFRTALSTTFGDFVTTI